jgi:hypothetical protein
VETCPQGAIRSDASRGSADISAFKDIWVVAETRHGEIRPCTLELMGCGRGLADALGHRLCAVLAGKDVSSRAEHMAETGVDIVYLMEDTGLEEGLTLPYVRAITDTVLEMKPRWCFSQPRPLVGNLRQGSQEDWESGSRQIARALISIRRRKTSSRLGLHGEGT